MGRLLTGIDVVELPRFRGFWSELLPAQRAALFSERELAYAAGRGDGVRSLAARFAAKEAVLKVLGELDGFALDWREIEVVREADAPFVVLAGRCAELARERGIGELAISLSHGDSVAIAQAVAWREEGGAR